MEQSNNKQKSEMYNNIYEVLARLPLEKTNDDGLDRPSAALEIEKLFLKSLALQNIMPRSLTAENGAKGLLLGEFHETAEYMTEDGDEQLIRVDVGWDTIKDIYAKIVAFYEAQ